MSNEETIEIKEEPEIVDFEVDDKEREEEIYAKEAKPGALDDGYQYKVKGTIMGYVMENDNFNFCGSGYRKKMDFKEIVIMDLQEIVEDFKCMKRYFAKKLWG